MSLKFSEINKKSEAELREILIELRKKLRSIRFKLVSNKVKNTGEIRQTKKEIARVLTALRSKKV